MDVQRALLSKIIHDRAISVAVSAKIKPEFFTDDVWRRIYQYIIDHWRQFGSAADLDVVTHAFPSYEWPAYPQSIQYFIEQLRSRRREVIVTETLTEAITLLNTKDDPDHINQAVEVMQDGVMKIRLETSPTLDIDFTQQREELMAVLDERILDPGYLRGISSGYRGIDFVTGGFQPEQLIVLIGLPKAMKSSTMLAMAKEVHRQGRVPLFIGFEMSHQEQEDRLISLYAKISLTKITTGALSVRDQRKILASLKLLEADRPFIMSVDMLSGTTVSGIQAKIMEYKPDVVFIDAAYLMSSELPKVEPGSAQALTDIARNLKKLAQSQEIPIVVSTQASMTRSKQGLTMFSPMYTQAWGQSADVLLGVERVDPDAPDTGAVMVKMKVLASRAGPRAETLLSWDWPMGTVDEIRRDSLHIRQTEDVS